MNDAKLTAVYGLLSSFLYIFLAFPIFLLFFTENLLDWLSVFPKQFGHFPIFVSDSSFAFFQVILKESFILWTISPFVLSEPIFLIFVVLSRVEIIFVRIDIWSPVSLPRTNSTHEISFKHRLVFPKIFSCIKENVPFPWNLFATYSPS